MMPINCRQIHYGALSRAATAWAGCRQLGSLETERLAISVSLATAIKLSVDGSQSFPPRHQTGRHLSWKVFNSVNSVRMTPMS